MYGGEYPKDLVGCEYAQLGLAHCAPYLHGIYATLHIIELNCTCGWRNRHLSPNLQLGNFLHYAG